MDDYSDRHDLARLIGLIGEPAVLALLEEFAGTRLYIPARVKDGQRITRVAGREAAETLTEYYGSSVIRVPLGRELRALHYRANGASAARIAVRLGMTEVGVQRMLRRLRRRNSP